MLRSFKTGSKERRLPWIPKIAKPLNEKIKMAGRTAPPMTLKLIIAGVQIIKIQVLVESGQTGLKLKIHIIRIRMTIPMTIMFVLENLLNFLFTQKREVFTLFLNRNSSLHFIMQVGCELVEAHIASLCLYAVKGEDKVGHLAIQRCKSDDLQSCIQYSFIFKFYAF